MSDPTQNNTADMVMGLEYAGATALVAAGTVIASASQSADPSDDAGLLQAGPYRSLPVRHDINWARHHVPTQKQVKDLILAKAPDITQAQLDFLIQDAVNHAPAISIPSSVHARIHARIDAMKFNTLAEALAHNNEVTGYELSQYRYVEDGVEYRFRHDRISEVMHELKGFQTKFSDWLESRIQQELETGKSLKRQSRGHSEQDLRGSRLNDMEDNNAPKKRRPRRGVRIGSTSSEQETSEHSEHSEHIVSITNSQVGMVLAAAGVDCIQDDARSLTVPCRTLQKEQVVALA